MKDDGRSLHANERDLGRVAAGGPCSSALAEHLAGCPRCRGRLARRDPSALFALLSALPEAWTTPPFPALAPPERGAAPRTALRAGLGALAGALAVAVVALAVRAPAPSVRAPVALPANPAAEWPAVVSRVDSSTARIVALVPPGGDQPSVTLILDQEVDL